MRRLERFSGKFIERVIAALGLGTVEVEGSDSLDNLDAVFQ